MTRIWSDLFLLWMVGERWGRRLKRIEDDGD